MKHPRIEFHILQSFPVTCLNRDDVGAPKSAIVGGVPRARVSSQCWKRQVRMALAETGVKLGIRTKNISALLNQACVTLGASSEQAAACASKIAGELGQDTLIFVSEKEIEAFASFAQEHAFDDSKIKAKDLAKRAKKVIHPALNALDIALFGRMVAKANDMKVEAAASFNHAISTHKVTSEIEFFTALDDLPEEQGSGHMGTLEFNTATYYRYISLDLGQLAQTLGSEDETASHEDLQLAIAAFTKALFVAVPSARQATQSGASPWAFAKVFVRQGQRLQVPFETPVKPVEGGYLQPSIDTLKTYLKQQESMFGSMFGKRGEYTWGEDETYSVDQLIHDLQSHVESQ